MDKLPTFSSDMWPPTVALLPNDDRQSVYMSPNSTTRSGLGNNLFSAFGRVFQTNYHPRLGNAPGNKQHSKTPAVLPSTIRASAGTPQHGKISLKPRPESKITIPSRSNKRQLSTRGKYHLISCGTPSYGNTGRTWQRHSYDRRLGIR